MTGLLRQEQEKISVDCKKTGNYSGSIHVLIKERNLKPM